MTIILRSLWLPFVMLAANAETFVVSIVRDGPSDHYDFITESFQAELLKLAPDSRETIFRESQVSPYDPVEIRAAVASAVADPDSDLVFTAGVISTEAALSLARKGLDKPVIGGALQLSEIGSEYISSTGSSLIPNYTFIASPRRIASDIALLKSMRPDELIYVLVDTAYISALGERLKAAKSEMQEKFGIAVEFIGIGDTAEGSLQKIPASARSAYVTDLPRLSKDERRTLYAKLAERKILTLAMTGSVGVELGALAGLASDNREAVARRAAVNAHFIALGQSTDQLPVYLPLQDRLQINQATAALVGWSPDYDTALAAEPIGKRPEANGKALSFTQALTTAREMNPAPRIAVEAQRIAASDALIARSALLPQLSAIGGGQHGRTHDAINPRLQPDYSTQGSIGLQLRQILFDDETMSGLRSRRRVAEASAFDTLSTELDVMLAASEVYFATLLARDLYEIAAKNLQLTENHYQLAQLRVEIGSSEPSEVFRWEQLRAQDRARLIQSDRQRRSAALALNIALGTPREAQWNLETIELGEQELFFMDPYLGSVAENTAEFMQLEPFLKVMAVERAPELKAFDLRLEAQGILLRQRERRYYLPTVSLQARGTHNNIETEFTPSDSESNFAGEISLSFPLFEGGRRSEQIIRERAALRQLEAQREQAIQLIEQRAMDSFFAIIADHPSIRLNRRALEAAEKNYASTVEKYSQGAASQLDLLDAQQTLLLQRQNTSSALYTFLTSIHRLQRSIAWFEFEQSLESKEAWADAFSKFLNK